MFGCYDEVSNFTNSRIKQENRLRSPINYKEQINSHSSSSQNNNNCSMIDETDKSVIIQSRRIRRCNWVRFLTVHGPHNDISAMRPNIDCYRNKAGQVVYEVTENLEPATELIAQFKLHDTLGNNNNNEDFFRNGNNFKNSMETSSTGPIPHPMDVSLLYSSQAIANMLLLDAISGIIKGNITYIKNNLISMRLQIY